MIPIAPFLIAAGVRLAYEYFRSRHDTIEAPTLVNLAWSGSFTTNTPRPVLRRWVHAHLQQPRGFMPVRSHGDGDEYTRGDASITRLPTMRAVRWCEIPLSLEVKYSLEAGKNKAEFRFIAPGSITFDAKTAAFFHRQAEAEFDAVLEAFNGRGAAPQPDDSQSRRDYELLGISPGATWAQVQAAYRDACLKFHPDRLQTAGLPPHLLNLAVREFQARTDAYQRLKAVLS